MRSRIYEGMREQVTGLDTKVINFKGNHEKIPVINVSLESAAADLNVVATVKSVTLNQATIEFSDTFTGYLHVHAFSA